MPRTKKPSAKKLSSKKPAAKKPTAKKQRSKAKTQDPKVLYPEVNSRVCEGADTMTAEQARELLGWEEETDKVKFGSEYLIKDRHDLKVRCHHNVKNRPIYPNVYEALCQEHLRRRWRLNGETIIVGRYGSLLNGQHTLISLVLASQDWHRQPDKWLPYWPTEPTMEKVVVFGITEDDETVNTMDTAKPRSLAEVLYRSELFAAMKKGERLQCARICDHGVRLLWHRTGAGLDAFAPRRTHSEALDFIARHPKLLECVKHVWTENGSEGTIQNHYVGTGYAAGLLYLMGSGATDPAAYCDAEHPGEEYLDWELRSRAQDFWVELAQNVEGLRPVRAALAKVFKQNEGTISVSERCAVLVKAWSLYAAKKPVTAKLLALKYHEDGERSVLAECPTCGGIDLGDPSGKEESPDTEDEGDPTPAEIEERTKKVRKGRTKKQVGKRSKKGWAQSDTAWVLEDDGENYFATLVGQPYHPDDGKDRVLVGAEDGEWDVALSQLSEDRPAD